MTLFSCDFSDKLYMEDLLKFVFVKRGVVDVISMYNVLSEINKLLYYYYKNQLTGTQCLIPPSEGDPGQTLRHVLSDCDPALTISRWPAWRGVGHWPHIRQPAEAFVVQFCDISTNTHTHTYTHIHIHIHTYTYTHTHTHTHTNKESPNLLLQSFNGGSKW